MPSIAQEDRDPICSKKRRLEDTTLEMTAWQERMMMSSSHKPIPRDDSFEFIVSDNSGSPIMRVVKTPKRQRTDRTHSAPVSGLSTPLLALQAPTYTPSPRSEHLVHGEKRGDYFSRRGTRNGDDDSMLMVADKSIPPPPPAPTSSIPPATHSATWPAHAQQRPSSTMAPVQEPRKTDLSPCHICHRRPTRKTEIDSFADCEGCGERTCWICIRECAGHGGASLRPGVTEEKSTGFGRGRNASSRDGHRRMICSRCCVERGSEGEVWCLGCLRDEDDNMG